MTRAVVLLAALSLTLFPFLGCGRGAPSLGKVSGTVTLDGEPLPLAKIEFQPKETGKSPSYARTDEAGNYTLMYSVDLPGALPGEHTVRITTYRQEHQEIGPPKEFPERLPARYNSETDLTREVTSGSQTIDFELESR